MTLNLYAADLIATALDTSPFLESDDPVLTSQRIKTQQILHHAIACSPMDGDLWVRLALISRALGADTLMVQRYISLSQRYAPYQGWILNRRDQLF